MTAEFTFRRSNYRPRIDVSAGHNQDYPSREVITAIGSNGGNFWNYSQGILDLGSTYDDDGAIISPGTSAGVIGDISDPTAFYQYPIAPSWAACEVYIRAHFAGTFTSITGVVIIATRLDLNGYGVGAYLNGRVVDVYPNGDPANRNLSGYSGPMFVPLSHQTVTDFSNGISPSPMNQSQTPDQGFLDLTPGASIGPGDGYSRYAVLQLHTGSDPVPGEGGQIDFSLYYDES